MQFFEQSPTQWVNLLSVLIIDACMSSFSPCAAAVDLTAQHYDSVSRLNVDGKLEKRLQVYI